MDKRRLPSSFLKRNLLLPFRLRGFHNKGAALILLWNFASFLLIHYSASGALDSEIHYALLVIFFIFPLAGWLADVYFGRYKVIRWSMWVIWVAVMAHTLLLLVQRYTTISHQKLINQITNAMIAVGLLAVAGFQDNAIQFGMDQFVDASSSELCSYISWYVWSFFLSKCVIVLTQNCTCHEYQSDISMLLYPIIYTLTLVSDALLNKWLIKEPVAHNPLKLIFRVFKYALKHKYPQMRSAFTYWEDEPYSRIDLAKTKYGGPFSTEEVEDVKTSFRILRMVAFFSLFGGIVSVVNSLSISRMFHYQNRNFVGNCNNSFPVAYMNSCYQWYAIKESQYFILVLLIPLFEFLLYPLLVKLNCHSCAFAKIADKSILGVLFGVLYITYILSLEVTATLVTDNHNVTCSLQAKEKDLAHENVLSTDFKWLLPSNVFFALSAYFLITSAAELVCAQAPYSMKGLLAGITFCLCSISVFLLYFIMLGIKALSRLGSASLYQQWCGVWYYLSVLLIGLVMFVTGFFLRKNYRPRRRDENVHNEQIFAVDYYEKYLPA